jgi:hypothetical protein
MEKESYGEEEEWGGEGDNIELQFKIWIDFIFVNVGVESGRSVDRLNVVKFLMKNLGPSKIYPLVFLVPLSLSLYSSAFSLCFPLYLVLRQKN